MLYARLYIDEVGNPSLTASHNHLANQYFSITGVIFEKNHAITHVKPEIEKLKSRFFQNAPSKPTIFHRKDISGRRGAFKVLNIPSIRTQFHTELGIFLQSCAYTVITVCIDKWAQYKKYQKWTFDPYKYAMELIVERYFYHLSAYGLTGDVMIEAINKSRDNMMSNHFAHIHSVGTAFVPNLSARIVSPQLKIQAKAANIPGLQIADLFASPSQKRVMHAYGQPINPTALDAVIINSGLQDGRYHNDGAGKILGYGMKLI